MQLNELTGIKHLKDKTPKELVSYIINQNGLGNTKLSLLGSGMNGVALTDGTNVFKFWHRDSAYEKFINLCQQNQDNPYFPKFKSKIKTLPFDITSGEGATLMSGIRYVKMELLSEFNTYYRFTVTDDVPKKTVMSYDVVDIAEEFIDENDEFDVTGVGMAIMKEIIGSEDHGLSFDLTQFLHALQLVYNLGESLDLHSGNFALRDKQLVILDPILNKEDLRINKVLLKA